MTAEDFFKELETDVARFQRYWHENHRRDPETFPLDLPPGDWHEQFLIFLTFTR